MLGKVGMWAIKMGKGHVTHNVLVVQLDRLLSNCKDMKWLARLDDTFSVQRDGIVVCFIYFATWVSSSLYHCACEERAVGK